MQLKNIGNEIIKVQDKGTLAVFTDDVVGPLYLDICVRSLEEAGFRVAAYTLPNGEESKSGETYLKLMEFLAEVPLTRTDGVVALGGGAVGDIAGFAAATFLRGIKVIQVPTTLLAAVDSSVGGKTAINLKAGKNLAGAFHQPALVFQDAQLLRSLPEDTVRDGMAEVIKYGMIEDAALFEILKDTGSFRRDPAGIIARCVGIKHKFVEEDEFDLGVRHLLNFGHTIAHAIEILSDFQISHGSAVAKGMDRITRIAADMGWCGRDCCDELRAMLLSYGFDLSIPYTNDEIYEIMKSDKKRKNNEIDIVIPEKIGTCVRKRMTIEELRNIL